MRVLGHYLLASPGRSVLMAFLLAWVPMLGWLSAVIVGLVTLRIGAQVGLIVALASLVADVVYTFTFNMPWLLLWDVFCGGIFIWVFAQLLRRYASWSLIIQTVMVVALILVILVHVFVSNVSAWWYEKYMYALHNFLTDLPSGTDKVDAAMFINRLRQSGQLQLLANIATGSFIILGLTIGTVGLMLARGWQAALYNPGGFSKEFYSWRIGYLPAILVVLCIIAIFFGMTLALDIIPVLAVPFIIAGFSLMHALASQSKNKYIFLVVFYVVLVIFYPSSLFAVMLLAFVDVFIDFRKRRVRVHS
jgi:hypothetical protein